jgi:hypothetical protein
MVSGDAGPFSCRVTALARQAADVDEFWRVNLVSARSGLKEPKLESNDASQPVSDGVPATS